MSGQLDGLSMNIEETNKDKLKQVFPECFTESKLDIDKLLSLCGEYMTDDFERYEFKWKGKSECLQLAQKRSAGTLRPCVEESVNWEDTKNLYIEGDNLEVLKLLQRTYYHKVKMIYIDPPYNTGNDFVYEDDFKDPLEQYREVTSQTTKSNSETMGRFHTNWLNMMYPRLRLAANLLREDGVCFISIDDNEVDNLKKICNETFGEENFVGCFVWQSKKGGGSDNNLVVRDQEYILAYAKTISSNAFLNKIMIKAEPLDFEDEQGKYRRGRELNKWGSNSRREDRPTMYFPIVGPNGEDVYPIRNDGTEGCWRWGKQNMFEAVEKGNVEFIPREDGTYIVYEKIRDTEPRLKPYRTFMHSVSTTADGSKIVKDIFNNIKVFSFPKPLDLIQIMLQMGTVEDDIILDFFSGSATTAHAVMQLNAEDGGNRQFIMVQLPEVCDEKTEAYKAGYRNICEIGKERIRRAGKKIKEEWREKQKQITLSEQDSKEKRTPPDVGFRVFKLDTSNCKVWDNSPVSEDNLTPLEERLKNMTYRIKPGRTDLDMVFEIMLKLGIPLTDQVIPMDIGGKRAYSIWENCLVLVCMEKDVTLKQLEEMADYAPAQMVFAQDSFDGSVGKVNAEMTLQRYGIALKFL